MDTPRFKKLKTMSVGFPYGTNATTIYEDKNNSNRYIASFACCGMRVKCYPWDGCAGEADVIKAAIKELSILEACDEDRLSAPASELLRLLTRLLKGKKR